MGSWQLEVAKMFLYVMIPVAAFHLFNKPELFQEWIASTRVQTYPFFDTNADFESIKQLKQEYQKVIREKTSKGTED